MHPTRWSVAVTAAASLLASGCALALVGAGVAGGYAISKDTVRNTFDRSKDEVFSHSRDVADEVGFISTEDPAHGVIKVKVQDTNVTITIKQLTRKTVELKVKARNTLLMPEIEVAQEVYNKIFSRL
jgi:hypothetical protein